jgi:hypothetical protein
VRSLLVFSLVGLAVMTVASGGVGWVLSGRVLRPVRTITETARRASEQPGAQQWPGCPRRADAVAVRAVPARRGTAPGMEPGSGLSIVQSVARAHGASVSVRSQPAGGLNVPVVMPRICPAVSY